MSHIGESLKQYCKIILTDIINNTKTFQHNYAYFQNKNLIDHQSRKEMIIRKLEELEAKHEEIIKKIPNIDESLKYFEIEKKAMQEKQDIEKIIENVHKNKLNFVKATEIFHEVNNKEKEIRDFSRKVSCYKIFCEVHEKIDENYKTIEKAIDQIGKFDFTSILKKTEEKQIEENNFNNSIQKNKSTKIVKSCKLDIKSISAVAEHENVLKDFKTFLILQNGNFTLNIEGRENKEMIKGKFAGGKITMQKINPNENDKSLFFEGVFDDNKLMLVYSSDSTGLSDLLERKDYMIEILFKLENYRINKNGSLICEAWLSKGDEFDNKLIKYGVCFKDNKINLITSDFTSKVFCRLNILNTEGSEEITGSTFSLNETEKIIDIKQ